MGNLALPCRCCIFYSSYIKPQLIDEYTEDNDVVSSIVPTSNHNKGESTERLVGVVSSIVPTSNHNLLAPLLVNLAVVSSIVPTSNHNLSVL